ncbi:hypothetical protein CJU94_02735 [Paraburkholderia aromaticivorans]|uniref:Uncharacterized protein n=1 Tax=Paraburkholderia aromaticivorans TaxID=2026199 RepID=A0A248VDV2_9BURK|nr:hypothetical protein CJU94_02735 [Paraburkholderia aromaticivorans]
MTGRRKLGKVNGAGRADIPQADASSIRSDDRTMRATTRAKAAMLPEPEKTGRAWRRATHVTFQRTCRAH